MNKQNKSLAVVIPVTRGMQSIPTIESAFNQSGFENVIVVVAGKSTSDLDFKNFIIDKFKDRTLHVTESKNKKIILPGEARNDGLRYVFGDKIEAKYLLFVDDDIILPEKYGKTLAEFLEKNNACAAMGRINSFPANFWTKTIDYSNFWWLQMEESVSNRKWLGAGATLTKYEYVKDVFFKEDAAVNEDVIFFNEISKKTSKHLSVCAETTCKHHHNRKNVAEFIKYQFNNGKRGVLFHKAGVHPVRAILSFTNNFRVAFSANRNFLQKNTHIIVGVFLSFLIFEAGIQAGSFMLLLKKIKNKCAS